MTFYEVDKVYCHSCKMKTWVDAKGNCPSCRRFLTSMPKWHIKPDDRQG
jgi:hypothetical protein